MNKIFKSKIGFMLIALLFVFVSIDNKAFAEDNDYEKYVYPINWDSPQWTEFRSLDEKLDACRIPEDVLKEMTTEQLVDAVLDFPLLVNVVLYNSIDEGLDALQEQSDAYRELLSREDGEKVLEKRLVLAIATRSNSEKGQDDLFYLGILVNKRLLDYNSGDIYIPSQSWYNKYYVTTPKGTNGNVFTPDNITQTQKSQVIKEIKRQFPNTDSDSAIYKCRSYVWQFIL